MLSILSFFIYTITVSLIFSKNPVHSVLKLILIFFLVLVVILLLFGANCTDLLSSIIHKLIVILFLFIIRASYLREKSEYSLGCNIFSLFYAFFLLSSILFFVHGDFYFLILTDQFDIHFECPYVIFSKTNPWQTF